MAELSFDRDKHEYKLGGAVVPSVTQVLEAVGLLDYGFLPEPVREEAKLRGRWVADLVALYLNRGRKLPDSLFSRLRGQQADWMGYFDAFRRFDAEMAFEPLLVEQRIYSTTYGYAGTLDLTGRLHARLILADVKTGIAPPTVWPQTSGYHEGLASVPEYQYAAERHVRAVIELHADGTYRFEARSAAMDSADRNLFLSALTVYRNLPKHVLEARK